MNIHTVLSCNTYQPRKKTYDYENHFILNRTIEPPNSLLEERAILNETFRSKFYLDELILTLSYTNLFSESVTKCLYRYFVNSKALEQI